MNRPATILLVEDTLPLARLYEGFLRRENYAVLHAPTGAEAIATLGRADIDTMLLDLELPDMNGMEILKHVRTNRPEVSVVVITAYGFVNVAVSAMREGAFDFIVKPFNQERIAITVRNAVERREMARTVERYRQELKRDSFHGFIGASDRMQAVYRTIESVAASRASVFITGESGTGKELAAEAIHKSSPRRDRPFIALNCAAIPKDLMESEVFGHVKGSFTGATSDRIGAARSADNGTLFLDEVCEMPLDLQAKLLRFIQTGAVQPVGSSRVEKVDVRFVCATNRDPLAEVRAGRFREDLYYRLHVVPIELPPLRDRDDDVLLIARTFLRRFSEEDSKQFTELAAGTDALFRTYGWPGNVRQLQNVVRNIVVLHDGPTVLPDMVPEPIRSGSAGGTIHEERSDLPAAAPTPVPTSAGTGETPIKPLWLMEKELIQAALRHTSGDVTRASVLLEISTSTIYRKIQNWTDDEAAAAGLRKSVAAAGPVRSARGTVDSAESAV
jgi:two-component system repressor protein LuxO